MLQEAAGQLLYHILPVKRAAVIYSSMRSGSTLLKALLGMNSQVSHIPEVPFHQWPQSRYSFYYRLWRSAPQPFVVLKKPCFFTEIKFYPYLPPVPFLPIVLIRNPVDTALSLARRIRENKHVRQGFEACGLGLIDYWSAVYEGIYERFKVRSNPPHIVFYEELLAEPERVTEKLFQFLGTKNTEGLKNYEPYGKWLWGKDDAGERIRTLTVNRRPRRTDEETRRYEEEARNSQAAAAVMRRYQAGGANYYDYLKEGGYL